MVEDKNKNKNSTTIIIAVALIAVIIVLIFFNTTNTSKLELKNAELSTKVVDYEKELKETKISLIASLDVIDSLKNTINKEEEVKQDTKLKETYNEKVRTINLYTVAEQQSYFDVLTGKTN